MSNRVIASLIGWISVGFGALLLFQNALNPILTVPIFGISVALIGLGLLRLGSGKRYLIPAALVLYCATTMGTLTLLFLADAPMVERAMGAIMLMVGALAALRAFYVATRRRRNSMRDYYDR